MRIYALIPKLSSDSVAFIYSSSASVSLSLLFFSRPHRPSPIKVPGEVVTDGEKSKAGKKRAKAPWAKPLSQYSQAKALASGTTIITNKEESKREQNNMGSEGSGVAPMPAMGTEYSHVLKWLSYKLK
ncbi:unnamed protein product [Brassica rapa]|uniref:Uncharacterized protein n=1 Tax=Brassica campestris TaxID=3711 RepID=M4DG94_BRACM|nr:unnamed protein product [Brassica rapa]